MKFNSLPQTLNHFKDQETGISFLAQQRWNRKRICAHVGSKKTYKTTRGHKSAHKVCHKKFTVTVGTIFESAKITLKIWFAAIYLATAQKKGISSLPLHRHLRVTQKRVWCMLQRISAMLREKDTLIFIGETQVDETFVGVKHKHTPADKQVQGSQGSNVKDKRPLFALVNKRIVPTQLVADTKAKALKPIIAEMVEKGSIIVSDEWLDYNGLKMDYQHEAIKHKEGVCVQNGFHTNSIEGSWDLSKCGIFGPYHYARLKHLSRYTDGFSTVTPQEKRKIAAVL